MKKDSQTSPIMKKDKEDCRIDSKCLKLFIFLFFIILMGFACVVAPVNLLLLATTSYGENGGLFLTNEPPDTAYFTPLMVGDRFAGVSTTGAVSLCTKACSSECRPYKEKRRCNSVCNTVFGDHNCTTVEPEEA